MLKGNEKRTFWIVVMAICAVSLVTAWVSGFVTGMDNMIDSADMIGERPSVDYQFSVSFLIFAFLAIVAAAVAHICTKGKNSMKVKIIWAAVIGGYFLLSNIIFGSIFYAAEIGNYSVMIEYVTVTLAITVSYEIAFLAQCMLTRDANS